MGYEMTKYPEPASVTPRGQDILDALRASGEWMTRPQIAAAIQRPDLNKWDIGLLNKLVDDGLVESRKVERTTGIMFAWEYRAIGGE